MTSLDAFDWLSANTQGNAEAENEKLIAEAHEQQMKFARLVLSVLGDGDGAALLQWLRDLTIEKPLLQVDGAVLPGQITLTPDQWMMAREGQNAMIRFLEAQIELARQPVQQQEGEDNATE